MDRDDDERAPAAHPAAELLDGDRGDAAEGRSRIAAEAARLRPRRAVRAHWVDPDVLVGRASGGVGCRGRRIGLLGAVTWRNSSSRSLAAREKVAIRSPAPDRLGEQPCRRRRRRRGTRARSCRPRGGRPRRRRARRRTRRGRPRAPSPSPRTRTRSTAPTRSRRSMSATRPWASTWPRSTIATRGAQLLELGEDVAADRGSSCPATGARGAARAARPGPAGRGPRPARRAAGPAGRGRACGRGTAAAACRATGPGRTSSRLSAEVDEVEQVADHPPPAVGRDPVAAREEVQVLPDLHVVVDAEASRA